jgi:TonB-dependent starch-binding outer membrane protein SusC
MQHCAWFFLSLITSIKSGASFFKTKTKLMRRFLLMIMLSLIALYGATQSRNISGKVTDSKDGSPIIGATIKLKGTNVGTSTGTDGTFQLSINNANPTLIISGIGFDDVEIKPGNENADIKLTASTGENLSEVVVVGYGTKSRKDVTSSIARVSAKDFQNQPLPSFEQALQGRSPGVYINTGSGKLGQALNIRVRGISSISANQQPFVVVDGVPVVSQTLSSSTEPDNPLATINPDDIESIEVLKDASSAAIYGARASNGVLLVTTKSGKQGKTKLNVGYFTGWSKPTKKQDFLNATQYRELFDSAAAYIGSTGELEFADNTGTDDWNSSNNTKWSDLAFQNGTISQYNVQLTGGDNRTKFLVSGSWNDQKGIIIGNRLTRGTGRINIDHNIGNKFKIGANLSLNQTNNYRVPSDNAFSNPIQLNALPPLHPLYNKEGLYNSATLYYNNLIEQEGNNRNLNKIYRSISNINAEWNIIPSLSFRSQAGIDWYNLQEDNFLGRRTLNGAPEGFSFSNQVTSSVFTWTNTFNYKKFFGEAHDVDVLLGTEYQEGNTVGTSVEAKAFPNDKFTKIASAAIISNGSSIQRQFVFLSYFLRANYKFKNRYLASLSMRRDGSSRFGKDNRYGNFPAASVGWLVSEEDFLKNSKLISFLKLRSSLGLTGNSEIGDFNSLSLYSANAYADISGLFASQIGVPNLKWEKTRQFDIGVDFGLFNGRVSGEVDYFNKNTEDLLLNVPLSAINGFTDVTKNIGSMTNKGWEFSLTGNVLTGDFKWTVSANISTYKNEITKLVAPVPPGSRTLGRLAVGQPFGQFYGKKYMGVDPANGDALYMTADGKTTNNFGAAVDTAVGNPNPDYYGGFSNRFSYKGFDLDVQCQFVKGNDLYNIAGFFQSVNGDYFDNHTVDQMAFWANQVI